MKDHPNPINPEPDRQIGESGHSAPSVATDGHSRSLSGLASLQRTANGSSKVRELGLLQMKAKQWGEQRYSPSRNPFATRVLAKSEESDIPSGMGIIQRVVTQILPSDDGMIDGIAIVGRPTSAHKSTMGDHSTAFTTMVAGISSQVNGKSIDGAFKVMDKLIKALYLLPGMKFQGDMPLVQKGRLKDALDDLKTKRDILAERVGGRMVLNENQVKFSSFDVGAFQNLVDAYLEARELVPLSTINTKVINVAMAGKGKGESALNLARAQKGQSVPASDLVHTIVGLFDARSAALVYEVSEQKQMDLVAPGVKTDLDPMVRVGFMINQHLDTVLSMFPDAYGSLKDKEKEEIISRLYNAVAEMIKENKSVRDGKSKPKKSGKGKSEKISRSLTAAIEVNKEEKIVKIRIDGRTKSPYPKTMGAHTTAWIVLLDGMFRGLVGKSLPEAATFLLNHSSDAQDHLIKASKIFLADTKQIQMIAVGLRDLGDILLKIEAIESGKKKEKNSKSMSTFQQILYLQEGIHLILNLQNLTPGATLDVANTNGSNEGTYRGILLNCVKNSKGSKSLVRQAILGLLDVRSLEDHIDTISLTVSSEGEELEEAKEKYFSDFQDLKGTPSGKLAESEAFLVNHHLDMIEKAYPGVLKIAGISKDDDYSDLLEESIKYSKDKDFDIDE